VNRPSYNTIESHRRALWDSLPTRVFINLDRLESIRSGFARVMVKLREATPSLPLDETQVGELPFGRLLLMTCGGVAVAYRIDAPKCLVGTGPNYATLAIGKPSPTDTRVLFVDGTLVVVGGDRSMAAALTMRRWIK
jgi:hypothetical protein